MQYHNQAEREEIQRREKSYLVVYFRDGDSESPVVERMTADEVKYLKDTRPLTFRNSCVLQGELFKGFSSDFWGVPK